MRIGEWTKTTTDEPLRPAVPFETPRRTETPAAPQEVPDRETVLVPARREHTGHQTATPLTWPFPS